MVDPYRYFRIEARELIDELAAGVAGLGRGEPATGLVGGLLRHAHTLKGAARVVGLAGIADRTHALEGVLEPFRGSAEPIPAPQVEQMLGLVDEIGDQLRAVDTPVPAEVPVAAVVPPDQLDQPEPAPPEVVRTARASLAEIDAVIGGVGRSRVQLRVLREGTTRLGALREDFALTGGLREAVEALHRTLGGCVDRMDRELREAHDVADRLRLVPVTSIMSDLEGAARDVAAVQGKRVHVEVAGAQLRLDAPVLSVVQGALRQIVRNAVAHGIEVPADRVAAGKPPAGRVRIEVSQRADQVVFSCNDDGRGIDLGAVRRELDRGGGNRSGLDDQQVLDRLALGGISTVTTVSEVSGRGIGLDVVRDAAGRLGGRVAIRTSPSLGTTIDLTTPLSLSAQQVLLMDDGTLTAIRLASVLGTARVRAAEITTDRDGEILRLAGRDLPFLPLAAAFGDDPGTSRSAPSCSVVILPGPVGPVAIGVRRLVGTATVAIHPLPHPAPISALVTGIWLDGDACPRLVLDPDVLSATAIGRRVAPVSAPAAPAPILIVDDSLTTRMLEQSVLESAGYRVELAASAEEGLLMAARTPYALALVDVEMPGMNGFEFVEQTRSRPDLRQLPCILVTSRASAADRERGLAAGALAHVDKREFHQGTLLDLISGVVDPR